LTRSSTYSPAKNEILVKHLLNHSSGISYSSLDKRTPDELNPAYTSMAYKGGVQGLERYSRAEFFRLVRVCGFWVLYDCTGTFNLMMAYCENF